jgi:hypothetical protein
MKSAIAIGHFAHSASISTLDGPITLVSNKRL